MKKILFAALFCTAHTFSMDVAPVARPTRRTHRAQQNVLLPLKTLATRVCMEDPDRWQELKLRMSAEKGLDEALFPDAHRTVNTQTLNGHTITVLCLESDPHNPRVLASGSADCTIRLWDTTTGECMRTLQGHPASVHSIAFNLSKKKQGELAAASENSITIWNTNSGQRIGDPINTPLVRYVVYNPHNRNQLASASLKSPCVSLWNLKTKEGRPLILGKVFALAFDPSTPNRLIAAGGLGQASVITFWDTKTGDNTHELEVNPAYPDRFPVYSLKFNPLKPEQFASGSVDEKLIQVWNAENNVRALNVTGTDLTRRLAWNQNNSTQIASTACDNIIKVWNTETGENSLTIREWPANQAHCLAFCPDDQLAAGLSNGTIKRWGTVRLSPIAAALRAYMRTCDTFPAHLTEDLNALSNEEKQSVLNG